MCGRFTLARGTPEGIAEAFELPEPPAIPGLSPRFNVAPTQAIPVVRVVRQNAEGRREAIMLRWGLIPHWSKGGASQTPLINARAETAHEKPAFRVAFRERRCLVVADGFYEWVGPAGKKNAVHFRLKSGALFGFAGLWETGPIESCTILTTEANALVQPIHERMPCILRAADYETWLDVRVKDVESLQQLLRPFPAEEMEAVQVGTHVNSARNEGPLCLAS